MTIEQLAPEQLSLFTQDLPRRPYCSNDLEYGLDILPAKLALERRYIQFNPPCQVKWLVFDLDYAWAGARRSWDTLAPPNIIVTNPGNGHAHYLYGIATPVCKTIAARQGPMRLLAAIYEGYRHALDADPGYAQLVCKNPLHAHWKVEVVRVDLYDLSELAEYVDLNAAGDRIRKTRKKYRHGLGRNCSLFDSLRGWAYKWVGDYRVAGLDRWIEVVRDRAEKLNTFAQPLPVSEVKATARSVAIWTFKHYTGKMTAGSVADPDMTPAVFSMVQSSLGRMGNAKRWGDNGEKREQAKALREQGLKQVQIAERLGVTQKTISKWLST